MVRKIFTVVLVSFLSIYSFMGKGLPPTHDGEYHVIRFYEFDKTFRDGNFYPRWAPDLNNGFGIPLFNYVYPLPNYTSLLFHELGSSFIDSFKLNMLLATLVGSIFVFLWAREFWGDIGGIISSSFFSFAPYRLLDIYIRGSVGEIWALSLFPGFLWAITRYSKEKNRIYVVLSSLFLSLAIFSHNILALMFFIFSFFYVLFVLDKKVRFDSFVVFILSLGLASIFWTPAILETGYVRGLQVYDYSQNFPELYQLIFPSWGSGFSNGSMNNQLSLQIGVANLLVILVIPLLAVWKKFPKRIAITFLSFFLATIILMMKISLPLWKIIPFMNYFQFPWRFLSLTILFTSFLAGGLIYIGKPKLIAVFSVMGVIVLGLGYAKPAYFLLRGDSYYTSKPNFIDGTNSPGDSFNTTWFVNQSKSKDKITSSGIVSDLGTESTKYSFNIQSPQESEVLVNTAYFPGWIAYVDNKKSPIKKTDKGLMSIDISPGFHNVKVKLENTGVRNSASAMSLISFIALLWLLRFDRIKR